MARSVERWLMHNSYVLSRVSDFEYRRKDTLILRGIPFEENYDDQPGPMVTVDPQAVLLTLYNAA